MTIAAIERTKMISAFRNILGDEVTRTLMDHLPPEGWTDVVRRGDLEAIFNRFDLVDKDIAHLKWVTHTIVAVQIGMVAVMVGGFLAVISQL